MNHDYDSPPKSEVYRFLEVISPPILEVMPPILELYLKRYLTFAFIIYFMNHIRRNELFYIFILYIHVIYNNHGIDI